MGGFANVLGQVVGVIAGLESLRRPGGLSDYFANRLTAQSDPYLRAGLVDSPFLAGTYGIGGADQLTPVDMPSAAGVPAPSAPDRRNIFQPTLPPVNPGALWAKELNPQIEGRLGLANLEAKKQEAEQSRTYQEVLKRFMPGGGGGAAGPDEMGITSTQIGPHGATFTLGFPSPITVPDTATVEGGPIPPRIGNKPVIKTTKPPKSAPVSVQNAITQGNALLGALENVRQLSEGATMGPAAGRLSRAADPFGLNTEQQSQFLSALEQLYNTYRLATTGQQASYQELMRIQNALPNANLGEMPFQARLKEVAKSTVRAILAKTKGAKESYQDAPPLEVPKALLDFIGSDDLESTTTTPSGSTTTTTEPPATTQFTPDELEAHRANVFGKPLRAAARR